MRLHPETIPFLYESFETALGNRNNSETKHGYNYLLTYDSYVPLYNRFHRGEWITRVSGGEGALDTPGPLNGTSEALGLSDGFLMRYSMLHLVSVMDF